MLSSSQASYAHLLRAAKKASRAGDVAAAIAHYEQALAIKPNDLAVVFAETSGDYVLGAALTIVAAVIVVAVMFLTSRSNKDEDL